MKSMHIAASRELVSRLSTHRRVVALDGTDFTDVAAVVITVADSHSGILALLKRTGFNLPVFVLTADAISAPEGVNAVISGKEQEWLELEAAASRYEEDLLPPFFDTLTQYVEMATVPLPAQAISTARSLKNTQRDVSSMTSLARTCFVPTCATPT